MPFLLGFLPLLAIARAIIILKSIGRPRTRAPATCGTIPYMAIITPGPLVQAVSGRLGSLCFSRTGSTPIVRTQPVVRRHNSARALAAKATFGRARAAWASLTDAQRLAWAKAAPQFQTVNRLGQARAIAGFNLFVANAARCLLHGIAPVSWPGSDQGVNLVRNLTLAVAEDGPATCTLSSAAASGLPYLTIEAQRLVSESSSLPGQMWRVVSRQVFVDYEVDFYDDLVAAFGPPSAGEWYRFQVTQWIPGWPRSLTTRHLVQVGAEGPNLIWGGTFESSAFPVPGFSVTGDGLLVTAEPVPSWDGRCAWWNVGDLAAETFWQTENAHSFALLSGVTYSFSAATAHISGYTPQIAVVGIGMSDAELYPETDLPAFSWLAATTQFTPDADAPFAYLRFRSSAHCAGSNLYDALEIRRV